MTEKRLKVFTLRFAFLDITHGTFFGFFPERRILSSNFGSPKSELRLNREYLDNIALLNWFGQLPILRTLTY